jgi:hypothetical protein
MAPLAPQWNRGWLKRSGYLQLPVSPGFSPGSLLINPAINGKNRNKYVNEQYNTTKPDGLLNKK